VIFPANLLTGAKHAAFSTNYKADTDKLININNTKQPRTTQTT